MSASWMSESIAVCVRWAGRALTGAAKTMARPAAIATLSLSQMLLELINAHLAHDFGEMKESLLRRQNAEAAAAEADALRKLAEAAEASNRATIHRRKDREATIERESKELANARTRAEIDAIRSDAESRKRVAIADARARLIEAISKLSQEGGALFFDKGNLRRILELSPDDLAAEYELDAGGQHPLDSGVSVRLTRALQIHQFKSIADLSSISEAEFLGFDGVGQTTLNEARQLLAAIGLTFKISK